MAARFGNLKFSLLRALEMLQDMNASDMDVRAPTSNIDCTKELAVARILNDRLTQLINEGYFDDCEQRSLSDDEDDEEDESIEDEEQGSSMEEDGSASDELDSYGRQSTVRSEGFDYPHDERRRSREEYPAEPMEDSDQDRSDSRDSRESFSNRFRRYVRRVIPRRRDRSGSRGGS